MPDEEDRKYQIYVETDTNAGHVNINVNSSNSFIVSSFDNPITTNNFLGWYYDWYFPITNDSSIIEDNYRLTINVDTDDDLSTYEKTVIRDTSVALLEQVNVSTNDYDNDDDGILDEDELNIVLLPETPVTDWTNLDVHISKASGLTKNDSSDSDGDGLPDGLELGFRTPKNLLSTDLTMDTDGDGYKNFIADPDPPFYNTYDNYQLGPWYFSVQ